MSRIVSRLGQWVRVRWYVHKLSLSCRMSASNLVWKEPPRVNVEASRLVNTDTTHGVTFPTRYIINRFIFHNKKMRFGLSIFISIYIYYSRINMKSNSYQIHTPILLLYFFPSAFLWNSSFTVVPFYNVFSSSVRSHPNHRNPVFCSIRWHTHMIKMTTRRRLEQFITDPAIREPMQA